MAYKDYRQFLIPEWHHQWAELKENWEFIDSIDFIPFLTSCDVEEIMTEVEDYYSLNHITLQKSCGSFVFNYIGVDEFMEYLVSRYPDIIANGCEETRVYYHLYYKK